MPSRQKAAALLALILLSAPLAAVARTAPEDTNPFNTGVAVSAVATPPPAAPSTVAPAAMQVTPTAATSGIPALDRAHSLATSILDALTNALRASPARLASILHAVGDIMEPYGRRLNRAFVRTTSLLAAAASPNTSRNENDTLSSAATYPPTTQSLPPPTGGRVLAATATSPTVVPTAYPVAATAPTVAATASISPSFLAQFSQFLQSFSAYISRQQGSEAYPRYGGYVPQTNSSFDSGRVADNTAITAPVIKGGTISNASSGSFDALSAGTLNLSGALTGTDATFSGTLTAGTLNVAGVSSGGAVAAPYFTATSTTATSTFAGALSVSGNIGISGSIIPSANNTYSLGSPTLTWRDLYVGPGSLYVNGKKVIEDIANVITISTDLDQNLITQTSGIGSATFRALGSGNVLLSTDSGNININSTSGNLNIGTTGTGQLNLSTINQGVWHGTAIDTSYLTGSLGTINGTTFNVGGTLTVASTTLLANNNTWSGANIFSQPLQLISTVGTTTIAAGQGFTIGESQFVVQQGSGNIGIGTTNPDGRLHVAATASTWTSNGWIKGIHLDDVNAIQFGSSGTRYGIGQSGNNLYIFDTTVNDNSAAANYRMTISGGNVGIGTTNPLRNLHIASTNTEASIVLTRSDGLANNKNWRILSQNSGAGTAAFLTFDLLNDTGSAATNVLNLLSNGNVGIGATAPGGMLEIKYPGNFGDVSFFDGNNNGALFQTFRYAGSSVGSITTNGTATAYNTTSDRRIKENIATSTLGLDALMQLPVRDFSFKADSTHATTTGFIAQELQRVFPWAVSTNGDNGEMPLGASSAPWSVDYGRTTPLIVKAVQEIANVSITFRSHLTAWLGDAGNGIDDFFAAHIHATDATVGTLCIRDSANDNTPLCVTKAQLAALLAAPQVNPDGSIATTSSYIPAPPLPTPANDNAVTSNATTTPPTSANETGAQATSPPLTDNQATSTPSTDFNTQPPVLIEDSNPFNAPPANDNASSTSAPIVEPTAVGQ